MRHPFRTKIVLARLIILFCSKNLTAWDGGDALILAVAAQNNNTIVIVNSVGPLIIEPWIDHPNVTAVRILSTCIFLCNFYIKKTTAGCMGWSSRIRSW